MTLKLDKLPDREAVRITFTASPELKAALIDYRNYLNGQHVALRGLWRKALSFLRLLCLPRHETVPAVATAPAWHTVSRPAGAGGGA